MIILTSLQAFLTVKNPSLEIFTICCVLLNLCACDIFNAQVELESIFDLRKSVSDAVMDYIRWEELRLELVRQKFLMSSGLSRVVVNNGHANEELSSESDRNENYDMLNPINAFLAIKALSVDLAEVLTPALDRSNIQALSNLMEGFHQGAKFPDKTDLQGAAAALTRLQDTYLLKTELLSQGCLQDDFCTMGLSVEDCFEIGKQSYQDRSYDHAIRWFTEALRKFEEEESKQLSHNETLPTKLTISPSTELIKLSTQTRKSQKARILEYLSWAQDIKNTLSVGKQFLAELTGIEFDAFIDEVIKAAESQPSEGDAEDSYSAVIKKFDKLCRGENKALSHNPSLKCSLSTRFNNPYFIIGPVKEEQLHIDPPLWVFHDVLYDHEIEIIKDIAKPLFKTATVVNSVTGGTEKSTTRVSKSAWLYDDDHDVITTINKRMKQLTNLDLSTSEDLQVANYGIGGMYLPHFDFSHTNETIKFLHKEEGNRIATLMFYMSDVKVGGGTAFPHLNVTIWPEKGAAAFWYNLKPDGKGDYRTQHGACPVLIGSKWVSNKWIHERGQEFIRPCMLQPSGPKHRSIDT